MATLPLTGPLQRLVRRFEHAPWAAIIEAAARVGYAARGAVHLSIGAVAVLAALDLTPRAEGATGALEAWRDWPAGLLLLWLVGIGLYAFAGWRALQAFGDVDRHGHDIKGLLVRAGQAISGGTYAALAVSTFGLLDAIEDLGEADDRAATRAAVAQALEAPGGDMAVLAAGLFVLGAGIGSIVRAIVDHFGRDLECDPKVRRWAGTLARVGYAARGIALVPAGWFVVQAGLTARSAEAGGLGAALDALERGPMGGMLLLSVGLGLVAFGLFAWAEGALRTIRQPRPAP